MLRHSSSVQYSLSTLQPPIFRATYNSAARCSSWASSTTHVWKIFEKIRRSTSEK